MYSDEYDDLMDPSQWVCDLEDCGEPAINGFNVEVTVESGQPDDEEGVGVMTVRYCPKHADQADELRRALVGGAQ